MVIAKPRSQFNNPHACLMVQGTTSDAGKSTLVAGLCRVLARQGYAVAPFKPQNMALNSAVTADGGEIGRAQALQAQAAGIAPCVHMNPILLKPNSDTGAQVIVQGRALSNMEALNYHQYKKQAKTLVLDSIAHLAARYKPIMVEGAGSPAEINLRRGDIANMGFAEAIDCPVILIADIDRGGVFAHLLGTLMLLSHSEQARVVGFVINRFRGDVGLLQPGIDWLEQVSGRPVLGVIPYLHLLHLEAEDAVNQLQVHKSASSLQVAVPLLPHMSNHTDFDALRANSAVNLQFVPLDQHTNGADLIILPGSKNVRFDLAQLKQFGWQEKLQRHLRWGGKLMGICGGLQMLGNQIADPLGLEGPAGVSEGFGLLDFVTELQPHKILKRLEARAVHPVMRGCQVEAYEIHAGISSGPAFNNPLFESAGGFDGCMDTAGAILATYYHGVFNHPEAQRALLAWAGLADAKACDYRQLQEQSLNRLADTLEAHMDMAFLKTFFPQ
ncbi:MAG: cobyric acid synthase [Marinagarivorans sp.]